MIRYIYYPYLHPMSREQRKVLDTQKARNGDTVRVAFDPHKVHLFDIETELTILN